MDDTGSKKHAAVRRRHGPGPVKPGKHVRAVQMALETLIVTSLMVCRCWLKVTILLIGISMIE